MRVSPARLVAYVGDTQTFTAVGTDSSGEIVHGVRFDWESSGTRQLSIDEAGNAAFLQPGLYTITCRAGSAVGTATVLVRPGARPRQTDDEWRLDQESLQTSTTGSLDSEGALPALLNKLMPTAHAQGGGVNDIGVAADYWVGSPPYAAIEATRMGPVLPKENFNIGIPLVNLGGRGLAANISAYYNSRVWGARYDPILNTTVYTFDPIQSWPSPGFTIGFGRIAYYDYQFATGTYALMLIDPDGTRHSLGRCPQSTTATVQTTDGTHITYVGSVTGGGTLYYQDGTKVTIGLVNNRLLPTQVTTTDGNYCQLAYKQASQGFAPMALDYVVDTLGRVIQFAYSGTNLISINPPSGYAATFSYQTVTMNTNFQNEIVVENVGSSFQGVSTLTAGYRPPYTFTYSGYGMIYGINWSSGGQSGSVTYNYPTGGEELYAGPTFSQRTETATNSPTGVYTYSGNVITRPDGSTLTLTSSGTGLTQSEIKNSAGVSFAKTVFTYANDPDGSPQVQSVTSYDDTGTPIKVDFDFDQYGNVLNKREYGWKIGGLWKVRRRTHYTYLDFQQYIDAYIRNRVSRVEVLDALENTADADDVLVGKVELQYDAYGAMGGMEMYSGAPLPPGWLSGYANVTTRGNVTGVTKWTSLSGGGTSTTHNSKLDKFGNVVKAQVSCCSEKSMTLTENTYWSQPEQVTKGNPTGLHLTSSAVYSFASGTVATQTNPNDEITGYSYDTSMRPSGFTSPSGATGSTSYNAWGLPTSSIVSYSEGGMTKSLTQTAVYNGFGQVIQVVNVHGGQVNTSYDAMGRVLTQTNPFPQGGTPGPATTYQCDVLGRVKVVTLPGGDTVQATYSGASVTLTDQVNRKIKRESDSLGRLVKVVEQDSGGTLTQETTYTYSMLDKLTGVNQGNQLRAFKYDTAGRLLFERIPEQTATINDGTGVLWSMKYTYTDFDAVATRTDARGVITTYGYDDLHRLTSVTYNTSGAAGVATTPNVTYNYDNNQSSATKGLLLSVAVGSGYLESYTYSGVGQGNGGNGGNRITLTSVTHTIESQNYAVNYQYNNANQRTQVGHLYPAYDNKGRLQAVKNSAGVAWINNIAYNIAGQVTGDTIATSGTVTNEVFGYDTNRMQLTSQTATRGSTTLMNLTYDYQAIAEENGPGTTAGNSGQLMSIGGAINGTTEGAAYTYDLLGRLATSSQTTNGVSVERAFEYDRWGNRTGMWDATKEGNQIQSVALQQSGGAPTNRLTSVTTNSVQANYTYDSAGNVTNDGAHSYTYDAENRLVATDGTLVTCAYDHQNRRVKKATTSGTGHYVWQGSQVLAEYNGSTGAQLVSYIYAGRMIAKSEGGVLRYVLSDRLSARLLLDVNGTVVGREAHLPFGEAAGTSGEQEKHRFTSYERDSETGLDYAINRGYSAVIGRFASADPYRSSSHLANPQNLNRYGYSYNDPINKIDPLGLFPIITLNPCAFFVCSGGIGSMTVHDPGVPGSMVGQPVIGQLLGGGGDPPTGQLPPADLPPPPLPRPTVPQGTPRDFVRALNRAFQDLDQRLRDRPQCAALFGGLENALRVLANTTYRFLDFGPDNRARLDPTTGLPTVTGGRTVDEMNVWFNSWGPFMNQRLMIGTRAYDFSLGLEAEEYRQVLLLHELGHQVGLFGDDANDQDANSRNTQRVREACF